MFRFVRRFARENPLLTGIYTTAMCYALVYISLRTVILPSTSVRVTKEQHNSDYPSTESSAKGPMERIVDVIKTAVESKRTVMNNTHPSSHSAVPSDIEQERAKSLELFLNSSQLLKPEFVDSISKHLDDYSYEISLPFLQNYLNPCWLEEMSSAKGLYINNAMVQHAQEKQIRGFLDSLAKLTFELRLQQGGHWRLRCLPYFYIIGMAKCGTTDLWDEIVSHPQVHPGLKKEYHWWSRARIDTDTPIREYIDLFDIAAEKIRTTCLDSKAGRTPENRCVTGESTVSTFWHCKRFDRSAEGLRVPPDPAHMTPGLMHRLQPSAKLILILRDPVTRLFSDYVFFSTHKSSLSANDFHTRCKKAIELMNTCFSTYDLRTCVHSADLHKDLPIEIFKSIYVVFLQDWLAVFPRSQLHILHMETYSQQRAVTMDTVFRFLELKPMTDKMRQKIDAKPKSNTMRKYKNIGQMTPETEVMLRQFFQPFNNELAKVIGDERYRWL